MAMVVMLGRQRHQRSTQPTGPPAGQTTFIQEQTLAVQLQPVLTGLGTRAVKQLLCETNSGPSSDVSRLVCGTMWCESNKLTNKKPLKVASFHGNKHLDMVTAAVMPR